MFLFVDPYKSQSAKAGAHSDIGLQSKDTRWVINLLRFKVTID